MDIAAINGEDEIELESLISIGFFGFDVFCRFALGPDIVQHVAMKSSQCDAGQAWSLSTD
jgi:hypothetical protein